MRPPTKAKPELADYLAKLGLPTDFVTRGAKVTPAVRDLQNTYEAKIGGRRFLLGLLIAFIGVAEALLAQARKKSLGDALTQYPPLTERSGRPVNTLTIPGPSGRVGLRGFYNSVEGVIVGKLRRFDYPRAAPHATQAWPQHRTELESLFAISPEERTALGLWLWDRVVELPEPRTGTRALTKRPFLTLLRKFSTGAQKGERSGAPLQGMVYAYYRADAPNLTIVAARVRAGGKRYGAVGDIDGWNGAELALSAEVKDAQIDSVGEVEGFIANVSDHPDATAIVVARDFSAEARESLKKENILVLDRETLARNVELWDVRKQQVAMRAFEYYIVRIETSDALRVRFEEFLRKEGIVLG